MKKRLTIYIKEELIEQAKQLADKKGRSFSDVIQDGLVSYLKHEVPDPKGREKAYLLFCERPMRLSRKQFKEVLKEENSKPG